jgi:hypothetical protein
MVTRPRASPIMTVVAAASSSRPSTTNERTVSSWKNRGSIRRNNAIVVLDENTKANVDDDTNASPSKNQQHHETTGKSNSNSNSQSSHGNSRRLFKGRNAFRRTLMLRRTNQQHQQLRDEKGSDESVMTNLSEEREAQSSPMEYDPVVVSPIPSPPLEPVGNIPLTHIETILQVFGREIDKEKKKKDGISSSSCSSIDLYKDVLHISSDATDREIRIAYFRRGREVLKEGGVSGSDGANLIMTPNNQYSLDPVTRTKFQAVSMAYEILSTPKWKQEYIQQGDLLFRPTPKWKQEFIQQGGLVFGPDTLPPTPLSSVTMPSQPNQVIMEQKEGGVDKDEEKTSPKWKEEFIQQGGLLFGPDTPLPTPSSSVTMPPKPNQVIMEQNEQGEEMSKSSTGVIAPIAITTTKNEPLQVISLSPQTDQAETTRPVSALRTSSSRSGLRKISLKEGDNLNNNNNSSTQRPSSVHWSAHVEELVFDQDPNEHVVDDDDDGGDYFDNNGKNNHHHNIVRDFLLIGESGSRSSKNRGSRDRNVTSSNKLTTTSDKKKMIKKKKRNKPKIVIDADELEDHLKRMDNEAERHFVRDFFDTFEESMDGILSLVDSFGETPTKTYRPSKKGRQKVNAYASTGFLGNGNRFGRSMSHDSADLDSKKEEKLHGPSLSSLSLVGDDGLVKRSQSFPLPNNNKNSFTSCEIVFDSTPIATKTTGPPSVGVMKNVRTSKSSSDPPDEKPTIVSSPHQQQETSHSPTTLSPRALLKPLDSPTKKRSLIPDHAWQSVTKPAVQSVTKVVAAIPVVSPSSVVYSESLFRPISPNISEASDLLTAHSDQFELESLAMSEFQNPFRDLSSHNNTFQSKTEDRAIQRGPANETLGIGNTGTTGRPNTDQSTAKTKRVNIMMVFTASGDPAQEVVQAPSTSQQRSSNAGKRISACDDVLACLDGAGQQDHLLSSQEPIDLRGHSISVQHCNSMKSDCVSDMSDSVSRCNMATKPSSSVEQPNRPGADASQASTTTTVTSNIASPSRRISLTRSGSTLSSRGDPIAAMDLVCTASLGDGVSVHSVDSAVEASGFFDYFVAYVSAILTECNAMEESEPGFHSDILGLFNDGATVHREKREPPVRVTTC